MSFLAGFQLRQTEFVDLIDKILRHFLFLTTV